jgi:cob(I)alamin adenosyltransferase
MTHALDEDRIIAYRLFSDFVLRRSSMKIYTRQGDKGQTGLWGGQRVPKNSARVAAYGTVDELNAHMGLARSSKLDERLAEQLARVQNELFVLGSDLATPDDDERIPRIKAEYITAMEQEIDAFESELEPLRQFILPGGTLAAAHLHLARTVCRRAERELVTLLADDTERVNEHALPYLNRLADWLFVAARVANARAGVADVPWQSPTG